MVGHMVGHTIFFLISPTFDRPPEDCTKIFILIKLRSTETGFLASFDDVRSTGTHLLDITG